MSFPTGIELRARTIGDDAEAGRMEQDGGSGDDEE